MVSPRTSWRSVGGGADRVGPADAAAIRCGVGGDECARWTSRAEGPEVGFMSGRSVQGSRRDRSQERVQGKSAAVKECGIRRWSSDLRHATV